jgi:TLC domain
MVFSSSAAQEAVALLFPPLVVQVGLGCLVCQIGLYLLFRRAAGAGAANKPAPSAPSRRPWAQMPGFTAHQVMVVPVLVYLSARGVQAWMGSPSRTSSTALDRMINQESHNGNNNLHFCEFIFAMMIFWDIPTCLATPALRDGPMLLHHIGMAFTAAVGMGFLSDGVPVLTYYAPFFFGVIEISSLPLIVVDLFHPKHAAWHAYLTNSDAAAPRWLGQLNEIARIVFAILFFLIRTLYFPYVTFFGVLPDVLELRALDVGERGNVSNTPFTVLAVINVLFSLLQMYWGNLLLRQVIKALTPHTSNEDNTGQGKDD